MIKTQPTCLVVLHSSLQFRLFQSRVVHPGHIPNFERNIQMSICVPRAVTSFVGNALFGCPILFTETNSLIPFVFRGYGGGYGMGMAIIPSYGYGGYGGGGYG